jgi:hypothetical protein
MESGSKFTRLVEFHPAWDRRHVNPEKNYGIGGVEIRFVLKGPLGATQFLLCTGWTLPGLPDGTVLPADLGYHSPQPRYDGQPLITDSCPYLDGKPCYYDGSTLAAERVFERLVREGDVGVWAALEEVYQQVFEGRREKTLGI